MTDTRKCRTCGETKEVDATNFLPFSKRLSSGKKVTYYSTECRLCYNGKQNKARAPDRVRSPGPKPGTIEHKFFCK